MVNFHSYVSLPEGTIHFLARLSICTFLHGKISRKLTLTASPRCPERCTVAAKTFPSKSKLMKSSQVETSIYSGCSYIFHDFPIVFLKKHSIYSGCCDFPMDLPWVFPFKAPFFMGSRWNSHQNLHVFPRFPRCLSIDDGIGQDPGVAAQDLGLAKLARASQKGMLLMQKEENPGKVTGTSSINGVFFFNWKIIVNGGSIPFFNVAHQIPVRLGNLRFESWIERVPDDIEGFRGLVR